jgi:hypothetical protein
MKRSPNSPVVVVDVDRGVDQVRVIPVALATFVSLASR